MSLYLRLLLLPSYLGHQLSIYAVKWNHLHPRTFLSASADWSVKLWDTDSPKKPVMSFDLNDTVSAACVRVFEMGRCVRV